jgi:hypothetical protein
MQRPDCRHWVRNGSCKLGAECTFVHAASKQGVASGVPALNSTMSSSLFSKSMEECRGYKSGSCKQGVACRYRHVGPPSPYGRPIEECRNFKAGECHQGRTCRYLHNSVPSNIFAFSGGNFGPTVPTYYTPFLTAASASNPYGSAPTRVSSQGAMPTTAINPYAATPGGLKSRPVAREVEKKVACRHWMAGLCSRGDICSFYHPIGPEAMAAVLADPVYRASQECRSFKSGSCAKGADCKYTHTAQSADNAVGLATGSKRPREQDSIGNTDEPPSQEPRLT